MLERWAAVSGERRHGRLRAAPSPPIRSTVIDVAHAPRPRRDSADDEIVRLLVADSEPSAVRVVTSDRWLGDRVYAAGRERRARRAASDADRRRMMLPDTRYARSDEREHRLPGRRRGALDLLFLPGWISQVEQLWEAPAMRRFLERLAAFGRLILFDSRGTGLSERVAATPTRSSRRRATRSRCSTPPAANGRPCSPTPLGGLVGATLAAEHPERVGALIMYASIARTSWAPDYDWAMTTRAARTSGPRATADAGANPDSPLLPRARALDGRRPGAARRGSRAPQRLAASPREARMIANATAELDVRELLPAHLGADAGHAPAPGAWSGTCATRAIWPSTSPAPATSSSPGIDSFPFLGDSEAIVEEVEEFLTGGRSGASSARAC